MASTPVIEFLLIRLKEDAAVEAAETPANLRLLDVMSEIKQAKGSNRVFFGRQLENPSIGVVAIGMLFRDDVFPATAPL